MKDESLGNLGFKGHTLWKRTLDSGSVAFRSEFRDKSRAPARKRVTLQANTLSAARREAFDLAQGWALGLHDPWDVRDEVDATVRAAADAWLAHGRGGAGWSPATLRGRESVMDLLAADLGKRTVRSLGAADVRAFVCSPRLAVSSQASYHRIVNTFLRWCVAQGYAGRAVTEDVPKPRAKGKARVRCFTREHLDAFVGACDAYAVEKAHVYDPAGKGHFIWVRDLARFLAATGLRKGEARHLRWCDVDLDRGVIRVTSYADPVLGIEFETKCDSDRTLPLFPEAKAAILAHRARVEPRHGIRSEDPIWLGPRGGILGESQVNRAFRRARELAGLPDHLDVHALRHSFASWLLSAGEDLFRVSRWMGHASIKTTADTYGHLVNMESKVGAEVFSGGERTKRERRRSASARRARWRSRRSRQPAQTASTGARQAG